MKVYPLMRYKKWYFLFLGLVTLFAFLAFFVLGLNYGIEFQGGVRIEAKMANPPSTNEVRSLVEGVGVKGPVVQPAGGGVFVITADNVSQLQYDQMLAQMTTKYGANKADASMEQIGPSFGAEMKDRALIAIAVSMLGILAFLSWRFDYKFAVPAIVALFHDVGLTLGIYAVTGRMVTTATVAAMLTILGYSLNDTIIVFDRIRENTGYMKRETYGSMVDLSIRQTVARSINTSIATLLPVTTILLFGGTTLKDFAFALFIGIISGTYSSIFVASPLLVLWKEREPRYRKRMAAESI